MWGHGPLHSSIQARGGHQPRPVPQRHPFTEKRVTPWPNCIPARPGPSIENPPTEHDVAELGSIVGPTPSDTALRMVDAGFSADPALSGRSHDLRPRQTGRGQRTDRQGMGVDPEHPRHSPGKLTGNTPRPVLVSPSVQAAGPTELGWLTSRATARKPRHRGPRCMAVKTSRHWDGRAPRVPIRLVIADTAA